MPQLVHLAPESRVTVFDVAPAGARLGSSPENDIVLKISGISRRHARVVPVDGRWVLEDLDSSTFVFVGGQRVQQHPLAHGDAFVLGDAVQMLWLEREDPARVAQFVAAPPRDVQEDLQTLSNAGPMMRRLRELESLLEVGASINSTLDPAAVLEVILQKALEVTGAERGILMLVENGELVPSVVRGTRSAEDQTFSRTFAQKVVERNQTIVSTNLAEDPRFRTESTRDNQITSIMCAPLVAEGAAIGCLYVDRRRTAKAFPPELAGVFTALAHQAAQAIRNARMTDALKRSHANLELSLREAELLHEVSRGLNQGSDPVALLKTCLSRARAFFGVKRASVMLVDQATDTLITRMVDGAPLLMDGPGLPLGEGIAGAAARRGETLIAATGAHDPGFKRMRPRDDDVGQLMCAPLIAENRCIGVMNMTDREDGRAFEPRDVNLLSSIAAVAAVAIEKHRVMQERIRQARLNKQIEDAREVQQLLLPRVMPAANGFQFAAHYVPANRIGGDYYDWMVLDERRIAVLVADVSGHHLASSIIMAMARNLLRMNARQSTSPAEVLRRTSQTLCEDIRSLAYVTVLLGVLDTQARTFTYANAGNHPALVRRGSGLVEELALGGCPVGMMEGAVYADETVRLDVGDLLLLYTDGLIEAKNAQNQLYELDRFRDAVARLAHKPLDELVVALHADVHEFTRGRGLGDDFTLLAIAAVPPSSDLFFHFPSRLGEVPRQVQRVLAHAKAELGFTDTERIRVALEAALENAVIHGNRFDSMRKVFVTAQRTPAGVTVAVSDEGTGFDAAGARLRHPEGVPRGLDRILGAAAGVAWNAAGNAISMEFKRAN